MKVFSIINFNSKHLNINFDYILGNLFLTYILQQQDPLLPNEEYVSYDVKSLFTNVPIQETID